MKKNQKSVFENGERRAFLIIKKLLQNYEKTENRANLSPESPGAP